MNNIKKKGFTLVELVIVIAVVAILAAVLIPTFSGIITKAEISADKQEVVIINKHLAMADKISNSDDLYKIIEEYNKEVLVNNFAPKSAKQGNHYWFDVQNKSVVLKTYEEILNQNKKRVTTRNTTTFSEAEANSLRMFSGYYLLDRGNSAIGEVLCAIENGSSDVVEKILKLAEIKDSLDDKLLIEVFLTKLSSVAIVGDNMSFVYNPDSVNKIYFASNIEVISNNIINHVSKNYLAKKENILSITLPDTVKKIKSNALVFDTKGVQLHTSFKTVEEIVSAFDSNATNATIIISTGEKFTIENNKLKREDGTIVNDNLNYSNEVKDFNISFPEDTKNYKSINDNLYIAYDYKNEIQLTVDSFIGESGNDVSSKQINWNSNNEFVTVVDGKIKLTDETAPLEKCSAVITATAVAGGVQKQINVYIARPREVNFKLAGLQLDMYKENNNIETIEIEYTGKNGNIFDFNLLNMTYTSDLVSCDDEFKVVPVEGNLFSISKVEGVYKLTLLDPTNSQGIKQRFNVVIGKDITKTFEVSVKDISADPFEVKEPFGKNEFLYRIGNKNNVPLNHFFQNDKPEETFTLSITDVIKAGPIGANPDFGVTVYIDNTIKESNNGTWALNKSNWQKVNLKFEGTGVVKIKIGEVSINFEVVDGNNVFQYSGLKSNESNVLLNDIKMSSGGRLYLNGDTLYGNDFEFDVTAGNSKGDSISDNCRISLQDSTLDNVRIIGDPFDGFSATRYGSLNICNVYSTGESRIVNCFISYCAAPVRLNSGNLEIVNTTLLGGSIANLDIRSGSVTLDNVTTINQKSVDNMPASEGSVGFGIIVWYENVENTTITIKGNLTQYNYMTEADFRSIPLGFEEGNQFEGGDLSKTFASIIFQNDGTQKFIYTDGKGTEWINTGIFSMTNEVGSSNINNTYMNNSGKYEGGTVSYEYFDPNALKTVNKSGYLFSHKKDSLVLSNPTDEYISVGQGTINPKFDINIGDNHKDMVEGDNNYCYQDTINENVIHVSFDNGGNKIFNLEGLCTAKKGEKNIEVSNIYVNDTPCRETTFTFDESGSYIIKFVFDDPYNYDKNGVQTVISKSCEMIIEVTEAKPNAKHAEFEFKDETTTEKIIVDNKTYISAMGISATDKEWGYIAVNGNKIFYPITNAVMEKNFLGTELQVFYYVFKDTITITDYKEGGTGSEDVYNEETTTMPTNLKVINGKEAKYTDINSACVNISELTKDGPSGEVWDFSASTTVSGTTIKNGYLAHQSPSGLSFKSGTRDYDAITVAQFEYTDNAGATYYYFVGYFMPNQVSSESSGGGGSCVMPDTLITLSNGTQKRVDELTGDEQLLVWNLETGSYDTANIVFVDTEEEQEFTIIQLYFSDGSQVNVIGEHGFFDLDLGRYVYIDEYNYSQYIGHRFVSEGNISQNNWNEIVLEKVELEVKITTAWSPVTHEQLCYYTNEVLSMPGGIEGLFNIFEVDTNNMKYDSEKMINDIEKYGLFTFEDFNQMIPEEAFIAFNGKWLKVAMGKGILTWDDIIKYAERYIPLM